MIATGEMHTVRDFLTEAARALDMPLTFDGSGVNETARDAAGRVLARVNPKYYRPVEVHALCGDASKARTVLGWKPTVSFSELVTMMARHDASVPYHAEAA